MQSLNHRLGLRKSSLLGAQPVTVAMLQSDQLATNIPTHLSNRIATGQLDDSDYQYDREEELYYVDGTKMMSQITMHIKDKERNMPQLIQ